MARRDPTRGSYDIDHACSRQVQGGREILVVDDDRPFLEELADGLLASGFVPICADSPSDALAIAESRPSIDAVLTDLMMPGTDGIEFIWLISRVRAPHPPPCIVMTAHASIERAAAAMRVRAVNLLCKPFAIDAAASALRQAIDDSRRPAGGAASDEDESRRARAAFLRQSLAARTERERIFGADIFSDCAWTMILEVYLAELTGLPMSTSSLVIASRAPPTTAMRRIDEFAAEGLIDRRRDLGDGRRTLVMLTPQIRHRLDELVDRLIADRGPGRLF